MNARRLDILWLCSVLFALVFVPLTVIGACDYPIRSAKAEAGCAEVNELISQLSSENSVDRARAAIGLGELGAEASAAAPSLAILLDTDPARAVRWSAATALRSLGDGGLMALSALRRALKDKEPDVRKTSAMTISGFGTRASEAQSDLIVLSDDEDIDIRIVAFLALVKTGNDPKGIYVSKLTDLLGDSDTTIRFNAALALGVLGPQAFAAVPKLCTQLGVPDEAPSVLGAVEDALESITGKRHRRAKHCR